MSNVPIREKVKRIAEAAKDGESYSESSKSAGMLFFYSIFGIAMLFLIALTIGLAQGGHYIGSAICLVAGGGLGFILLKLARA
ncbi:hypothetical protein [Sporosarcina gallistercoris]|uniref:Uncharacterized protein n=1 Tax=Sporosarcina gallistercoris TaxID=2762245 RepID=A0ABR8PKI1_9BACL|nr:hypothetical protein [Sporosarcina gallistercoris]MBD7908662.1 hypothetical protein [Sporosarcina gallistercoris]